MSWNHLPKTALMQDTTYFQSRSALCTEYVLIFAGLNVRSFADQHPTHESPTSLRARKIQPLKRGVQVVALILSQDFLYEHIQVLKLSPSPLHSHKLIPQKRHGHGVGDINFGTRVQLRTLYFMEPLLVLCNQRVLHLLVISCD